MSAPDCSLGKGTFILVSQTVMKTFQLLSRKSKTIAVEYTAMITQKHLKGIQNYIIKIEQA